MSRSKRFRENLSLSLSLSSFLPLTRLVFLRNLRGFGNGQLVITPSTERMLRDAKKKEREKEKNKKKKIASLAREKERRRHARSRKERNLMGEHPRRDFHIHN